jgi:hypothetical protein
MEEKSWRGMASTKRLLLSARDCGRLQVSMIEEGIGWSCCCSWSSSESPSREGSAHESLWFGMGTIMGPEGCWIRMK